MGFSVVPAGIGAADLGVVPCLTALAASLGDHAALVGRLDQILLQLFGNDEQQGRLDQHLVLPR
jgi:hypothetical protein